MRQERGHRRAARLALVLPLGATLAGCSIGFFPGTSPVTLTFDTAAPPPPQDAVTYYPMARDVLDRNCVSCHHEGGPGGFALDTYAEAWPRAGQIVASVDAGRMPLWLPDPACHPLQGERVMSDQARDVLRAWLDLGAPEGVPDGRPAYVPTPTLLEDTTHHVEVPGFVPRLDRGDVRWCFLFDELLFDEEMFAEAHQVVAGSSSVHHATMFTLSAKLQNKYQRIDDASPGFGFPCASEDWEIQLGDDPSLEEPDPYPPPMNVLAPLLGGTELVVYPEGVAMPLAPGTMVGLVVHYSSVGETAEPDFTEIRMRLTRTAPTEVVVREQFENRDLLIPAGEPSVAATRSWPYWGREPVRFAASGAHMHLLGTSFLAEEVAPDGSTQCLLSVPAYDYEHAEAYVFPDTDLPRVQRGHRVQVTCEYDNSAANQPVIDGVQREVADVGWGKDTEEEMCLFAGGYLDLYRPPIPEGEPACSRVDECGAACTGTTGQLAECRQACAEQDPECARCYRKAALDCDPLCPTEELNASPCWDDCVAGVDRLGGSLTACLEHQCPDEAAKYDLCVQALVEGKECPRPAARCGL